MNQANAAADDAAQRQRQAQADAATQRAMQQALQRTQSQVGKHRDDKTPAESNAQREQREAIEQWLRQVPDDPGGLLRRKFAIEYQRRQAQGEQ